MARILLIEDNAANMQLMAYLLLAFGHTPLEAHDGEAGLEIARREALDLIVCDVQLPRTDGYGVVRRLKEHPALRTIPVVAVTALAMVGDRDKVLAAGFDGYIPKPITPESFVGQVEAFLPPGERSTSRPEIAWPPGIGTPPPPAPRATILIVDNTFGNIAVVRAMLGPFGFEVLAAYGIAEALAVARQSPPDLILSDVFIGGESGYDLIRHVKADSQLRAVPFIFISSTTWSERDVATALQLGAAAYLTRPIEPQALLKTVEAHLRK